VVDDVVIDSCSVHAHYDICIPYCRVLVTLCSVLPIFVSLFVFQQLYVAFDSDALMMNLSLLSNQCQENIWKCGTWFAMICVGMMLLWRSIISGSIWRDLGFRSTTARTKRHTFVIAPGGFGKSSLLRYLCLRFATQPQSQGQIAIFTSAKALLELIYKKPRDRISYEDLVGLAFGVNRIPRDDDFMKELVAYVRFKQAGIHLLVDGLDEVSSTNDLLEGIRSHSVLRGANNKFGDPQVIQIVISSRPGVHCGAAVLKMFNDLQICPLSRGSANRLLQKMLMHAYVKNWDEKRIQSYWIRASQYLIDSFLVRSPLMVVLVVLMGEQTQIVHEVFENEHLLFNGLIEMCFAPRNNERPIGTEERRAAGLVAMLLQEGTADSQLIVEMLTAVYEQKSMENHKDALCSEESKGTKIGREILDRVIYSLRGLLYVQNENNMTFFHRRLQEYLCTEFLVDYVDDGDNFPYYANVFTRLRSNPKFKGEFRWNRRECIQSIHWYNIYRFAGMKNGPAWLLRNMFPTTQEDAHREWVWNRQSLGRIFTWNRQSLGRIFTSFRYGSALKSQDEKEEQRTFKEMVQCLGTCYGNNKSSSYIKTNMVENLFRCAYQPGLQPMSSACRDYVQRFVLYVAPHINAKTVRLYVIGSITIVICVQIVMLLLLV